LKVKRTAAHCNALQHTATHSNTLQRTATHFNTLLMVKHTVTHYKGTSSNTGLTWEWSDWIIWEMTEGKGSRSSNRIRNTTHDMLVTTACLIVPLSFLATRCNLLQHCNTHCHSRNYLQLTATHCNTLSQGKLAATFCNTLQYTATHHHSPAVVFRN